MTKETDSVNRNGCQFPSHDGPGYLIVGFGVPLTVIAALIARWSR
jgi:hypothetical protein